MFKRSISEAKSEEEASLRVGTSVDSRYMFVVLLWVLCLTKTLQAATATTGMLGDDVKDTFFCHDKRFRLNKIAMRRLERTNYVLFKGYLSVTLPIHRE